MEKRRNSKKQRNLIAQGGMMAVMSLLVSACLVLRRIPLTMIWGDEGNGIYGAAYALFTLCWLLFPMVCLWHCRDCCAPA